MRLYLWSFGRNYVFYLSPSTDVEPQRAARTKNVACTNSDTFITFDGHRAFGIVIGFVVAGLSIKPCFGKKNKIRISTAKKQSEEKETRRRNEAKLAFYHGRFAIIDFLKVCATSYTCESWNTQFELFLVFCIQIIYLFIFLIPFFFFIPPYPHFSFFYVLSWFPAGRFLNHRPVSI